MPDLSSPQSLRLRGKAHDLFLSKSPGNCAAEHRKHAAMERLFSPVPNMCVPPLPRCVP